MRTRVKICGFTRVEEAVYAAQLGVDAIGLVFYAQSPRFVDIKQASAIVNALPAFVSVVGLFVNESEMQIRQVLSHIAIDCLQFHGNEPSEACRIYNKPYIKAVSMRSHVNLAELALQYHDAAGLLVDTYHPEINGGTGLSFDWAIIPKQRTFPLILAGGLDAGTVKQAIEIVSPYAVDVSSGVETEKGIKDALKMAAFIQQVNETNQKI